MEINEKKNAISAMMEASMGKIREMVDSNTVVGEPIVTADGVTLIPVSRLSFGFGCGGGTTASSPTSWGPARPPASGWSLWRFWWSRTA